MDCTDKGHHFFVKEQYTFVKDNEPEKLIIAEEYGNSNLSDGQKNKMAATTCW